MENTTLMDGIQLLQTHEKVRAYVDAACAASDANKKSLGFIQRSVFEEFARRDELWVMTDTSDGLPRYCGHLMFQRRFPRAQILQIFIAAPFQGRHLASYLIGVLKKQLSGENFLSIYARVASDLKDARRFWEARGFYVQSIQAGGKTTGRKIIRLVHELSTPQLFAVSGLGEGNALGLSNSIPSEPPLFLIDLNVLFDLSQPRRLRHNFAVKLAEARQLGYCRIGITDEIARELARAKVDGRTDPMASTLLIWPTFPIPSGEDSKRLEAELLQIVFPDKFAANALSENDRSDIRHLVITVAYDAAGFVTSDRAILNAAKVLEGRYGLIVISPEELALGDNFGISSSQFSTNKGPQLSLNQLRSEQLDSVLSMLRGCGISSSALAGEWSVTQNIQGDAAAHRYAIWSGDRCLGYVAWPNWTTRGPLASYAAVDDKDPLARDVARVVMKCLKDALVSNEPREIRLNIPDRQASLREVAYAYGFRTVDNSGLVKVVLGRIITESSWKKAAIDLEKATGIRIPEEPPSFSDIGQHVKIHTPSGHQSYCSIGDLETLLSPTIFALTGRKAVLTPIRQKFSNALLGHSRQISLLPQESAQLFSERIYVCGDKIFRRLCRGMLVLFYESGTKGGQIVAVARLQEVYLSVCDDSMLSNLERSALTSSDLDEIGKTDMRTIMVIDNIFPLKNPVGKTTLAMLDLSEPNHFITTRTLSSEQVSGILAEALAYEV